MLYQVDSFDLVYERKVSMFMIYHAQAPIQLSAFQPMVGILAMAAQWCLKRNTEEKSLKRSFER